MRVEVGADLAAHVAWTTILAPEAVAALEAPEATVLFGGGGGGPPAGAYSRAGEPRAARAAAAASTPAAAVLAGKHQAMHVRYTGHVTLTTTNAAGEPVLELIDRRPRTWLFDRGPLPPDLPARDLGLSWRLLAIH